MKQNLIGNSFEYDLRDIAAAAEHGNATAIYLRDLLAAQPVEVNQYTVESWRAELSAMGDLAPLRDLANHAMLARAWSWHTCGEEQSAWREAAECLERRIIVWLAQGWRSVDNTEAEHAAN